VSLVHGFDWFQSAKVFVRDGECTEDHQRLPKFMVAQLLQNIVHLHNLDVAKDLERLCEVAPTIKHFWPRLTQGGIMMFDHYKEEVVPGTRAIRELLPHAKMRNFSFGWMPIAYAAKD
jgi:hypothetical protein